MSLEKNGLPRIDLLKSNMSDEKCYRVIKQAEKLVNEFDFVIEKEDYYQIIRAKELVNLYYPNG